MLSQAGLTMTIRHIASVNLPVIWVTLKMKLLPYHELGKHKWVAMGEEYNSMVLNHRRKDHGTRERHS